MSNEPPAVSLELSKLEAEWLRDLLLKAKIHGQNQMKEIGGMPSSDPRAKFRAMLLMASGADAATASQLADRIEKQIGEV